MRTTTTKNSLPLMVALACTAAAAASCAQVEADVPDAQVTQKSVSFQGMPGASQIGEVSTTQSFTLSGDKLSWASDLNSEIYAHAVEFKAVGAVQDLSFIHYARITMSGGSTGSANPPVEIIDYQRPDNYTPTSDLTVPTLSPIDVTKVWAAGDVVITMQLAGVFPEQNWSADVTLHLGGKISYKF